jgi:hypothetical protein
MEPSSTMPVPGFNYDPEYRFFVDHTPRPEWGPPISHIEELHALMSRQYVARLNEHLRAIASRAESYYWVLHNINDDRKKRGQAPLTPEDIRPLSDDTERTGFFAPGSKARGWHPDMVLLLRYFGEEDQDVACEIPFGEQPPDSASSRDGNLVSALFLRMRIAEGPFSSVLGKSAVSLEPFILPDGRYEIGEMEWATTVNLPATLETMQLILYEGMMKAQDDIDKNSLDFAVLRHFAPLLLNMWGKRPLCSTWMGKAWRYGDYRRRLIQTYRRGEWEEATALIREALGLTGDEQWLIAPRLISAVAWCIRMGKLTANWEFSVSPTNWLHGAFPWLF